MRSMSIFLTSFLFVSCIVGEPDDNEVQAPIINEFTVSPLFVNEGEPVSLSVSGAGIIDCKVRANGNELEGALALTETKTHIPTALNTEYKAVCSGPGGSVEAASEVISLVLANDIFMADSLSEIGSKFSLDEIKKLALTKVSGEISDFDPEVKPGSIEKSKNFAKSVSKSTTSFSREHSLWYGYEGYHDLEAYSKQCEQDFDEYHADLYAYAQYSDDDIILEPSTVSQEIVLPNKYHIADFKAVTQSLENPIPQGTEWDVSFGLSQTKISYLEKFTDYGGARGVFTTKDDGEIVPVKLDKDFNLESVPFSSETLSVGIIPDGYPLPPKKDGYPRDPNHPTCNTDQPKITIETIYNSPRDFCERTGHIGCEPGYENKLPNSWPHRVFTTEIGKPITDYFGKFRSSRIGWTNSLLQCNELFPKIAEKYGLDSDWVFQTKNNDVLFFNNTPNCDGVNCVDVHLRLSENDPETWDIEPANNYCIDRWKGLPWEDYIGSLQDLCEGTDVFIAAVTKSNQQGANGTMIKQCKNNSLCRGLVEAIRSVLNNSYTLNNLEKAANSYQGLINKAKENGTSFVIPFSDPVTTSLTDESYLVSRLKDYKANSSINPGINSLIRVISDGYQSIEDIHKITGGDWNAVLMDEEMTGMLMPEGFRSPEELASTIKKYKAILDGTEDNNGINAIVAPEITRISCDYEVTGRIRYFSRIDGVQAINERVENVSLTSKAESIAPVATK